MPDPIPKTHRATTRIAILAALVAWATSGCVVPPVEPMAVLDPESGASITIVDQPLLLARERRDVAVQARDYLTFVAAEINDSGHRRLVWIVHQWSTIDSRSAGFEPAPGAPLLLVADGRDLRLNPIGDWAARKYAAIPALRAPEDSNAITTTYAVDLATLEYVASSRRLSAAFPESRLTLPFGPWRDGRPALQRFVERVAH